MGRIGDELLTIRAKIDALFRTAPPQGPARPTARRTEPPPHDSAHSTRPTPGIQQPTPDAPGSRRRHPEHAQGKAPRPRTIGAPNNPAGTAPANKHACKDTKSWSTAQLLPLGPLLLLAVCLLGARQVSIVIKFVYIFMSCILSYIIVRD